MITKEATCSKCEEIYNPENFGDLHYSNDCNGAPINQIEIGDLVDEICEDCDNGTEWPCDNCLSDEDKAIKKAHLINNTTKEEN